MGINLQWFEVVLDEFNEKSPCIEKEIKLLIDIVQVYDLNSSVLNMPHNIWL